MAKAALKTAELDAKGRVRAATRDASFYQRPNRYVQIKYHVVTEGLNSHGHGIGGGACGAWLNVRHRSIDTTVPAASLNPKLRCMKPACARLWPAYSLA